MILFNLKNKFILFVLFLLTTNLLVAADWDFRGQLSGWAGGSRQADQYKNQIGLRYISEGSFLYQLSDESFLETLTAFNMHISALSGNATHNINLYRLQLRFASAESEVRLGLQKISFGPARLLRSLRWFDQIDPTDPLRLTSGVYALRYTYNFLNNSTIWLWAMYGNKNTKGFETMPSVKTKPEFGGRLQIPVPFGETGLSVHSRRVNGHSFTYRENRLALDGRFDILVGLWFEASLQKSETQIVPSPWQKQLTLGGDYTFGIGNGLYLLAEHLFVSASDELFNNRLDGNTSALMLSYPVGIFDSFQAVTYYSWNTKKLFQYYNWQRTYDSFILNFSLFHYPASEALLSSLPFSGYGAQIMFIFNY